MVILERKRIKQLDGVIKASISGVGNVAGSYLETILVGPAGAHAQLSVLHKRRPRCRRPGPAQQCCKWMQGIGMFIFFIFFFLLALRPKTTASFITRRVLRTAPRESQSHKWQINLISAPLCSEPSFLLSIQISSESFSPLVRRVICGSGWNERRPQPITKLSCLTVPYVIQSLSLLSPFFFFSLPFLLTFIPCGPSGCRCSCSYIVSVLNVNRSIKAL